MKGVSAISAAIALCGFAFEARAENDPSSPSRLVIYTLRSAKELEPLAQRLSDHILIHLEKRSDLKVFGEMDIRLTAEYVRSEADLTSEDCRRAAECLARLSQMTAGADHFIEGRVAKLQESFVVTLTLIDAKRAIPERSESCAAENPSALQSAVVQAVDALLGRGVPEETRFALPDNASRLIVVPLIGLEERSDLTKTLTQLLGYELRRNQLEVWTSDEVLTFLEHTVQRETCKGAEGDIVGCILRFGDALSVNFLATGAVGRFDDGFVLVLKMIDIDRAEVVHRISESYRGPESQLPLVMRLATSNLLGRALDGAGALDVVTDISGTLTVDTSSRTLPLKAPVGGLPAGKHSISVVDEDDDYYPFSADAVIMPASTTRIPVELIERPVPWYRHWIFWSAVGVVAVAGTATTIYLLQAEGGGVQTPLP